MAKRGRELRERREHERITAHVVAREPPRRVDRAAEEQQVEVERPGREALGAAHAPALVLDVIELALDVVGSALRRERKYRVQEIRALKPVRRAAVDVRAANAPEALDERGDREPKMALRLDVAVGPDIDGNHNPPLNARSRRRRPSSPARRPASRPKPEPTARRTRSRRAGPRPRQAFR